MNKTALKRAVTATIRAELAERWRLPMDEYKAAATIDESYRSDTGTVDLAVTFTHRTTEATIEIENIIADGNTGSILESDYYRLA